MNSQLLVAVDAWEREVAAGKEHPMDALAHLKKYLRHDTIEAVFARLAPESQRWFVKRARAYLLNFEALVADASSDGVNPETYFVIREWVYRQPFTWRNIAFDVLSTHTTRGTGSQDRLFEEVVPLLGRYSIEQVVAELRPGWRNGLREFGRGLRPGLDVVCAVAQAQSASIPTSIRAFVAWAQSTKLERTHWERGE